MRDVLAEGQEGDITRVCATRSRVKMEEYTCCEGDLSWLLLGSLHRTGAAPMEKVMLQRR